MSRSSWLNTEKRGNTGGKRRGCGGFPGGEVGQQQLWARGGGGQQQEQQQWNHGGDGQQQQQQQQQQHDGWKRQHQPHFPVQRQRNKQHLSCHQQRSTPHQQQRFRPPSQHPHQRGGPESGPGELCNCGKNATWYQEESPVPANAPMGTYRSVRDAEGADIWPASVGYHGGLRGTALLVESTVISVASALRHAGPSPCSRMPTWSLDFSKQPPARLFGLATARLPCM